jgi:transposase
MTLHPTPSDVIPAATAAAAAKAFRKGNLYVRMRDRFGTIFGDEDFAAFYPRRGQPGYAPWRLALVTLVQYLEHLSDELAAEQVRARIDLKYLLGLDLTDEGFDASVLSEFRTRLVEQEAETLLFGRLLQRLHAEGLVVPGGQVRTDATHVLAAVQRLNRLALVRETLRHALNDLARVAPDWLRTVTDATWVERYEHRSENERLPKKPREREDLTLTIGQDGSRLLTALDASTAPSWLREIPAARVLRRVWIEQYTVEEEGIRFRTPAERPPCGQAIASPYDPEARRSWKRGEEWVGRKSHLSEGCGDAGPHVLRATASTPATTPDGQVLAALQQAMQAADLPPDHHLVDGGYIDADHVVSSGQVGIRLIGPLAPDTSWQAQTPGAFPLSAFVIDWDQQTVRCPAGEQSVRWTAKRRSSGTEVIVVLFSQTQCQGCGLKDRCTTTRRRQLMLRPQAQPEALQRARAIQQAGAEDPSYAMRAGIEGTISQAVRHCDLRHGRYIGDRKARFQTASTGAALSYLRTAEFLTGHTPAKTRRSRFAQLFDAAA